MAPAIAVRTCLSRGLLALYIIRYIVVLILHFPVPCQINIFRVRVRVRRNHFDVISIWRTLCWIDITADFKWYRYDEMPFRKRFWSVDVRKISDIYFSKVKVTLPFDIFSLSAFRCRANIASNKGSISTPCISAAETTKNTTRWRNLANIVDCFKMILIKWIPLANTKSIISCQVRQLYQQIRYENDILISFWYRQRYVRPIQ